ncbi:MAG TPA: 30S ribosomal protein S18 [Candidatus Marinimicrobia bacterium]|nr:30S ribosomal protein S18 [Candidatus Neomarinimicrobiota bacterium]
MQKKKCPLCAQKIGYVDYKDVPLLRNHTTRFAKIKPRRFTGTCLQHQKILARAIKKARIMGLLLFVR